MKKLDLNIDVELDKSEKDAKGEAVTGVKVALMWISSMLERSLNKPDPKTNRPTVSVGMEVQRKYFNVMDALGKHKDGLVELEDDDFSFLDRKYNQAEMPIQRGVNEVLIKIGNVINKAKVSVKKEDKGA